MKPNKKKKEDEGCIFERFILCAKLTNMRKDTQIDFRNHCVLRGRSNVYSCYLEALVKPKALSGVKLMEALICNDISEKTAKALRSKYCTLN